MNHGQVAARGGRHTPVPNAKGPVHTRKSSHGHIDVEEFYPGPGIVTDSRLVACRKGVSDQLDPQAHGPGARTARYSVPIGRISAEGIGPDVFIDIFAGCAPIDIRRIIGCAVRAE